jgi:uncharacterized Zn finger protein
MSDWWNFEHGPRRAAKDGIKAKSQRGDIGESWWSKRFIAALQALTDPGRLSRGRSYARSGQVMDLKVSPGTVAARVQGSRATPYAVKVALKPFLEKDWERVEAELAGQAIFLAALLAGEMPRDVEQAFAAAGLSLFPTRPDELRSDCSCPDWSNPCKHVAATYYILAEAFDADPFLVLAWRGRPRDALLEHLRELRGADPEPEPQDEPSAEAEPAVAPTPTIAPARTGSFWSAGPELAGLRYAPRAPELPDAVLRQLGALPPEAGGQPATDALAAAYAAFTAAAERRALAAAEPADDWRKGDG